MTNYGTPRERVRQTLRGQSTGCAVAGPLAVHYCAGLADASVRDYTLDPRVLADCVVRYYEQFRPDAVWLSADTWITAQAMGAAVAFPGERQPLGGTGTPCVRAPADIDRIPPPAPESQGRFPVMLQAMRYLRAALGNDVFIVACFDQYPFSLACALMGVAQTMTKVVDDRAMVEALMERGSQYAVAYALALAEAGADMLSGGDSPAGLLGPRWYRDIALPYERRVIHALKARLAIPISLHICGDATAIMSEMAASGAHVLELDHRTDLAAACRTIGPETAIWGNLDPVSLLARGTSDQVRRATSDLLRLMRMCDHNRFVVSSGCTLAMDTPAANLRAMLETAHDTLATS